MNNLNFISEIGINHNGDINLAKKLIKASKDAGANIVKFQKREIPLVYSEEILNQPRTSPWGKTNRDQKIGLEFGKKEYDQIDVYCKDLGIKWFASAWDLKSQEFLKNYNCEFNKIASAMIVDQDLLEMVSKEKKYTFISTGMTSYKDIDKAVKIFKQNKCEFELMHCISKYPFEYESANLKCIETLRNKYECNVGYSGHEKSGFLICCAAVALGATSIERHITLDRTMYGSDQAASLEPEGFKKMIDLVNKVSVSLGDGIKDGILKIEEETAKKLRAHINLGELDD